MKRLLTLIAFSAFAISAQGQANGRTGTIASEKTMTNASNDTSTIPYSVVGKHVSMSAYIDTTSGTTGGTIYFERYLTSTNRWYIMKSETITATDKTYGYDFGFIPTGKCRTRTAITGTQTSKLTTEYGFK